MAQLFVREHLAERRLRGISGDRTVLELFGPVTRHERLEPKALASVSGRPSGRSDSQISLARLACLRS